jgi:hypothetical protein
MLAALTATSCDPEKTVNMYFKQLGLNRLAVPRSDVEPGGLIIVKGRNAVYEGSLYDWISGEYVGGAVVAADKTSDYKAVLKRFKGDRKMDAGVALKMLDSVLPVEVSASAGLQGKVEIDLVKALGRRMKIADIQRLLNSNAAVELRGHLDQIVASGGQPYVAFETLRANRLKVTTDAGSDISTALKTTGAVKSVATAQGNFSLKRSGQSELEIAGDEFYVFAIRTGRLRKQKNLWSVEVTSYVPPSDWGIKAAGTDDTYSAPLMSDFESSVRLGAPQ